MKVKIYIKVILAISVLSGGLQIFAEEDDTSASTNDYVTMPPKVVTATRDERELHETPYSASILDAYTIQFDQAARTTPEAMENMPGVMVQKTAHGQGSPYIRGFTGNRDLFLVDGIRLNNSVFRNGPNQYWNTVDAFGLDRLEVVRGPFSTLYGSDAIGGAVNAITRGAQNLRADSDWDRRIYYRHSSAENSHIARAETIAKAGDGLNLALGYTYKDFGNIEGGKDVGEQPKTGYDERDWDAKLQYFMDENSFFVLAHQGVEIDDAWRTHKTIYGIEWEGLTVGDELRRVLDQDRDLTYLQFHDYDANGIVEEVHAGISHQLQSEDRNRLRTGDRHDRQGFDVHTYGAFLTLKNSAPIGDLTYGAEVYHDDVDSYKYNLNPDGSVASRAIQGPIGDDSTYDNLGLHIQDDIALGKRISFILGARYENLRADSEEVEDPDTGEAMSISENWDDMAGSARLLFHLDKNEYHNLFAGVSQGFRAPNLSDITRFDTARTDEIETPAPGLDPEHFTAYEIGFKSATPKLSTQIAYFYTAIDGMIVRTPTGRVIDGDHEVTKKNAGDGYVQGVEFDARYRLWQKLIALGNFTWMEGKVDTYPTSDAVLTREYIDRLMPVTGSFGVRWEEPERYWIEALCQIAGRADKLSTRDKSDTSRIPPGGTPGYTVYDVRVGWNCRRDVKISLAVENITDEDYRIHGSGVNEPGRNLVVATDWTF